MKPTGCLEINKAVDEALQNGKPVVALESTIISHGMPYPQNLETALGVESIIREQDAVPATIAILAGKIRVGLDQSELESFAKNTNTLKVSRRDLPLAITKGADGGTTVAATMICARLAGIHVFVTGGIGGVHRDYQTSLDVSADLTELALTNVCVVCAGIKSVLDIPRTLEYLETRGVPVIGYRTDDFPAFYTPKSGRAAPVRMDKPEEIARFMKTKWDLGLDGGLVIGNPVPEENALDEALLLDALENSLQEASVREIRGKDVTPFLLEAINQRTQGSSLSSNIALVRNNACLGAQIAGAFCGLKE